ncbi:MAG: MFS transporter [Cellvibrionales bacterium]
MTKISQFSALERRAVTSLATLYSFRMLGLFMILPVLALEVSGYPDFSPWLLGLTLGIYGLTQAMLQIPLGLLSDRIGRRPVVVGGLVVFIIGSLLAANADSLIGILFGRALQGMGAIASTLMAMVTDFTEEKNRTKAMAAIGGSIGISFMLAMMVGPLVVSYAGLSGVFWLSATLGVLGIVVVLVTLPKAVTKTKNRETQADTKQLLSLLKDANLMRLNIGIFALHFALMACFLVIPDILSNELQIPATEHWWVYLALLGGGFFIMLPPLVIAERRGSQKTSFIIAIACMALSMAVLSIGRNPWLTPILLLVFFSGFNLLEAVLPSWMSKMCPVGSRGTAMGVYSTSQFLGTFFGGLMGGLSVEYAGADGLFVLLAMVLLGWLIVSIGLQTPRALHTYVVNSGGVEQQDFAKRMLNIAGVEDILVVEGEQLAYVRVDRKIIDLASIEPYLNSRTTGEHHGAWHQQSDHCG